ncbi:MAG: zinc ribbon domain-containing protein [Oscillospiraceae bacterium]|nr:zinc ribbon domain-containing protein [Oscillospiraceae bacterium]
MNIDNEYKQYCVWCGAAGDKRSTFCTKCGKKMDPDENLLIDYLVSRSKSKFKSKAINTVYDAIKTYLLSHLYGVVIIISVVAVIAADYITEFPGVELVSETPDYVNEFINKSNNTDTPVLPSASPVAEDEAAPTEEDMDKAIDVLINAVVSGDTETVQSLYLPDSYGYSAEHQMTKSHLESIAGQAVNLDTLHYRSPYRVFYANDYLIRDENGNSTYGLEPQDITKQLIDDGYTTNEMVMTIIYLDESENEYGWARYIVTMVYADGKWYTAGEEFYNLTFARL